MYVIPPFEIKMIMLTLPFILNIDGKYNFMDSSEN